MKWYTIKIGKDKTLFDVKKAIEEKNGVPPEKMRLYYRTYGLEPKIGDIIYQDSTIGRQLDDNKTLEEQNVVDDGFFELNIKLC